MSTYSTASEASALAQSVDEGAALTGHSLSLPSSFSWSLFANLPAEAWMRSGVASENRFTVRAMAFIVAGHVEHHVRILRERYL